MFFNDFKDVRSSQMQLSDIQKVYFHSDHTLSVPSRSVEPECSPFYGDGFFHRHRRPSRHHPSMASFPLIMHRHYPLHPIACPASQPTHPSLPISRPILAPNHRTTSPILPPHPLPPPPPQPPLLSPLQRITRWKNLLSLRHGTSS